ncbi:threonine/serine transporter TdcC, partial [Klebsiella pneumoniae]
LFFPIRAGFGGLIPILVMLVLAYPIAFYCHRALSRLCLSGAKPFGYITVPAGEHFGKIGGGEITMLHLCVFDPLTWMYVVQLPNALKTFLGDHLQKPALNRGAVELLLLLPL